MDNKHRTLLAAGSGACTLALLGCEPAPSVSVLGSYFPVWIFCMLAGIGLTISVRYLLIRANLQEELGPRAVIYPSLVALFTFTIWLIFYRD